MGLVEKMKAGLERQSHAKKWEKEVLRKIAKNYGKEAAKKVREEIRPTKKASTYHTYVSRMNMVYQLLLEGTTLEDAITKAKKY